MAETAASAASRLYSYGILVMAETAASAASRLYSYGILVMAETASAASRLYSHGILVMAETAASAASRLYSYGILVMAETAASAASRTAEVGALKQQLEDAKDEALQQTRRTASLEDDSVVMRNALNDAEAASQDLALKLQQQQEAHTVLHEQLLWAMRQSEEARLELNEATQHVSERNSMLSKCEASLSKYEVLTRILGLAQLVVV